MENGGLSSNLVLDGLMPAASVRAVDDHSPRQDPHGNNRHHSRQDRDETEMPAEPGEAPEHQLDRLA